MNFKVNLNINIILMSTEARYVGMPPRGAARRRSFFEAPRTASMEYEMAAVEHLRSLGLRAAAAGACWMAGSHVLVALPDRDAEALGRSEQWEFERSEALLCDAWVHPDSYEPGFLNRLVEARSHLRLAQELLKRTPFVI